MSATPTSTDPKSYHKFTMVYTPISLCTQGFITQRHIHSLFLSLSFREIGKASDQPLSGALHGSLQSEVYNFHFLFIWPQFNAFLFFPNACAVYLFCLPFLQLQQYSGFVNQEISQHCLFSKFRLNVLNLVFL